MGILSIIKDFRVTVNNKTKQPIAYEKGVSTAVKGGLWLNIEKID